MCHPESKRHLPHTRWLSEVKERVRCILTTMKSIFDDYITFESDHECDVICTLATYYNTVRPLDTKPFALSCRMRNGRWEAAWVTDRTVNVADVVLCLDAIFVKLWTDATICTDGTKAVGYSFHSSLRGYELKILKHLTHSYLLSDEHLCLRDKCVHAPWYLFQNHLFIRSTKDDPNNHQSTVLLQKLCPLFCCLDCLTNSCLDCLTNRK